MATAQDIKIRITAEDRATATLKKTSDEIAKVGRAATGVAAPTKAMNDNLGMVGRRAGMAGIQVQQLVGQITAGTNPMQALSMQAADLGFVLGAPLIGAVAGIAAAIAGSLIPQLFEASKTTSEWVDELEKLIEKQGEVTEAQRKFIGLKYEEKIKEQRSALSDATAAVSANKSQLNALYLTLSFAQEGTERYNETLAKINAKEKERTKLLSDVDTAQLALNTTIEKANEIGRKTISAEYLESLKQQSDLLGKNTLETIMYTANLKKLNAEEKQLAFSYAMKIQSYEDQQKALKENRSELDSFIESIELSQKAAENYAAKGLKGMEDGMIALISGTKDVSAAFKDMARNVVNELLRMQIRRTITGPLARGLDAAIDGWFNPQASVDVGTPTPKAVGGPIQAGKPYMVGERGPELIIPSQNGQVIPNSQLGGNPVNVTLNISTGVSQTVRAEIANLMPQITSATKAAVADARMRGGSYSAAMGA